MMNFISRGKRLPALLLAGVVTLSLAGCDTDEIVQVEDPSQLQPSEVDNAAAVPALVNGAFRQFQGGYSGLGLDDAFVSSGAVLTDEFYWGDSFTTRFAADRRTLQAPVLGNISDPAFSRLMQARMLSRRAYAAVGKFEADLDDADAMRSELRTVEGFSYVTLSEGWCGGVPFSNVPDEGEIDPAQIEYGSPINTAQMNETAIPLFNEAIGLDGNRLAIMGKARALLNLGRYAEAATTVASIPTTYVFHLEHSVNSGTENNPVAALLDNGRYSISNFEGAQTSAGAAVRPDNNTLTTAISAEGLNFRMAQDPRIPWQARPGNGRCFTSSIFCWRLNNYPNFDADLPLASGVEARLIEAEAALNAGNVGLMLDKLNALRASVSTLLPILYPDQIQTFPAAPGVASLGALTDPGTAAARRDLLFRERAFWLYATGHRLGDLRRLIRQYGLTQAQVFPTGPYFRGGTFGTDINYPVPFNEENNTNFQRSACVTTQA